MRTNEIYLLTKLQLFSNILNVPTSKRCCKNSINLHQLLRVWCTVIVPCVRYWMMSLLFATFPYIPNSFIVNVIWPTVDPYSISDLMQSLHPFTLCCRQVVCLFFLKNSKNKWLSFCLKHASPSSLYNLLPPAIHMFTQMSAYKGSFHWTQCFKFSWKISTENNWKKLSKF